jgi:hypothetical protein
MRKSPSYSATYWRVAGRWRHFWRPLEVSARGKGPARPTQRPALHPGSVFLQGPAILTRRMWCCSVSQGKRRNTAAFRTSAYCCHVFCVYSCMNILRNICVYELMRGTLLVIQWLRHCATKRKVAGSIHDRVIGIFHWHNPSGRTTALGSTQPLTEMSTRNHSWR